MFLALRLFIVSLGFSVISLPAFAVPENDYTGAYNICSPASHYMVRQMCRYGSAYDATYQRCMEQSDLLTSGDEDKDRKWYRDYLQTHKNCEVTADHSAIKSCDYGPKYNSFYNDCMYWYGFDSNGEYIGQSDTPAEGDENKEYFEFNF